MRNFNGAQYLVAELERAGIQMAFGFPGESTLPLYSAYKQGTIKHVMARCERCAGYMADAYARLTHRVAVCDAPGGIGSPHVLPALQEAYNSAIPLVMITTATSDMSVHRWATSHCKHEEMFAPAVKEVLQVHTAERLGELVNRAINIATSGRPGPVHLDIATNLLSDPAIPSTQSTAQARATFPRFRPRPDPIPLLEAVQLFKEAKRPIIVAGGGVLSSGAESALEHLASTFRISIATTFNGKGSIAETSPFSIGVVGAKGCVAANQIAEEADVILWLGSKAGDKSTNYGRLPSPKSKIIQVDIDPEELGHTLNPTVSLCADITAMIEDFHGALDALHWQTIPSWYSRITTVVDEFHKSIQRQVDEAEHLTTIALIKEIEHRYAHQAIIVADASRACSWVGAFYSTAYAGRTILAPRGTGSIGYALPATIAAALAYPERTIIGIGGDGGFAMACHELETAVRLGLRFIFIILNNNSLSLLNLVAGVSMNEPGLLDDFAPTDWEMVARGFGCNSQTITSTDELSVALDNATSSSIPTVLNVLLPANEESPDFKMFASRHVASQ